MDEKEETPYIYEIRRQFYKEILSMRYEKNIKV